MLPSTSCLHLHKPNYNLLPKQIQTKQTNWTNLTNSSIIILYQTKPITPDVIWPNLTQRNLPKHSKLDLIEQT